MPFQFVDSHYFLGCNPYGKHSVLKCHLNVEPSVAESFSTQDWHEKILFVESFFPDYICEHLKSQPYYPKQNPTMDDFLIILSHLIYFAQGLTYQQGILIEKNITNEAIQFRSSIPSDYYHKIPHFFKELEKVFQVNQEHQSIEETKQHLHKLCHDLALDPSSSLLLLVAKEQDIPYSRHVPGSKLLRLGYGRKQRTFLRTISGQTNFYSVSLAKNKSITNRILRELGLPVPTNQTVFTVNQAIKSAQKMAYPLAVKPDETDMGKGVSTNIQNDQELINAFNHAKSFNEAVLLETMLYGKEYRVTVANQNILGVVEKQVAHVIGNGENSVGELIETINRNRKPTAHPDQFKSINIDQQLLDLIKKQGFTLDSTPHTGQFVKLGHTANMSMGSTTKDVTQEIHPNHAAMVLKAVQALDLDLAGVDLILDDISQPISKQSEGILEVNFCPGMNIQLASDENQVKLNEKIFEAIYPTTIKEKVFSVACMGVLEKEGDLSNSYQRFHHAGLKVCISNALMQKVYPMGIQKHQRTYSTFHAYSMDRDLDALLFEISTEQFKSEGLGLKELDLLIIQKLLPSDLKENKKHFQSILSHVRKHILITSEVYQQLVSSKIKLDSEKVIIVHTKKTELIPNTSEFTQLFTENKSIILKTENSKTHISNDIDCQQVTFRSLSLEAIVHYLNQ